MKLSLVFATLFGWLSWQFFSKLSIATFIQSNIPCSGNPNEYDICLTIYQMLGGVIFGFVGIIFLVEYVDTFFQNVPPETHAKFDEEQDHELLEQLLQEDENHKKITQSSGKMFVTNRSIMKALFVLTLLSGYLSYWFANAADPTLQDLGGWAIGFSVFFGISTILAYISGRKKDNSFGSSDTSGPLV